jgi:hypothetical protein
MALASARMTLFAGCWRGTSLPTISIAVTGDACKFAANSKSSQPNTSRQKSFCLILSNPSVRSRETTRPVWLERKTTFRSKKFTLLCIANYYHFVSHNSNHSQYK